MALHLLKLAVGCESVEALGSWQQRRLAQTGALFHETRHYPLRAPEIADGGSIYWVVRGQVRVRQRIVSLERRSDGERGRFCRIHLDPVLVRTVPQRRRPHQGWRYLDPADAPPDAPEAAAPDRPPAEMAAELRELGLL